MVPASAWMFLILLASFQSVGSADSDRGTSEREEQPSSESLPLPNLPDVGPLFLTKYINECKYDEAKIRSEVSLFRSVNATAYSGYITVNESMNSNLFFLFIVSEGNKSDDPVVLWTQGGPGLSSLFGQFLQNGPLKFQLPSNLTKRDNTLQKHANMIYLDVPVGAGFSYTKDLRGYSQSMDNIIEHVLEFLRQFFLLFSEYQNRPFYLAGESYGARYSVAVANALLNNKDKLPLKLEGVIGGNGFLGPITDIADSSKFLYQVSMLTADGLASFEQRFKEIKESEKTNPPKALQLLFSTIFTSTNKSTPTLFQSLTMFNDHASPLHTERPRLMLACYYFLNTDDIKKEFHVGLNATFEFNNENLQKSLLLDWLADISEPMRNVLNNLRVLLYFGQIDALFPSVNQRMYMKTFEWTYAAKYRSTSRCAYKPNAYYYGNAGYLKQFHKFAEAVLLGMSHYGAVDKPDEVYYLMMQFINKTLICPADSSSPNQLTEN
uniref:Putative serine carboxypeptidase n=1 Tax=Rhipicephalus pulchellus TaxID=72859 RepID=L7M8V2_RHIPC